MDKKSYINKVRYEQYTNAASSLSPIVYGSLIGNAVTATTATYVPFTGLTGTPTIWNQNTTGTANLAIALTTTLPISGGGTGQTTVKPALNALLPTQVSKAGKYLRTEGVNAFWDDIYTTATSANDLTGPALAASVVNSSLTSLGTLTNLSVTNAIVGSITGNSATATNVAYSGLTGTVPTWNQSTTGNALTATTATSATTAGTVTTPAQTAITSVGTLTGLTVNGTLSLGTTALISSPSATALAIQSQIPAGTGVTPTIQIICPSAAYTLTSQTATQKVFDLPQDTITLQASTSYMFDGQYILQTGTTSHFTSMSFVLTTATITNMTWYVLGTAGNGAGSQATSQTTTFYTSNSGGQVIGASTNSNTIIKFEGIMRVNVGGTLVPNIAFSAAPTGTNLTLVGSYLRFYPIGSNTIDSVGTAIG